MINLLLLLNIIIKCFEYEPKNKVFVNKLRLNFFQIVEVIPPSKKAKLESPPKKQKPFKCLNSDCRTEINLIRAKDYVRRYFGVLQYPK